LPFVASGTDETALHEDDAGALAGQRRTVCIARKNNRHLDDVGATRANFEFGARDSGFNHLPGARRGQLAASEREHQWQELLHFESRLATAARMKPEKSGCGANGLLLNSG